LPVGYSIAAAEVIRLPLIVNWTCTGPYLVLTDDPVIVRVAPLAVLPDVVPVFPPAVVPKPDPLLVLPPPAEPELETPADEAPVVPGAVTEPRAGAAPAPTALPRLVG
jgi:hypothetical protein